MASPESGDSLTKQNLLAQFEELIENAPVDFMGTGTSDEPACSQWYDRVDRVRALIESLPDEPGGTKTIHEKLEAIQGAFAAGANEAQILAWIREIVLADEPSAPQIPDKPCPHNTPVAHKADGRVSRAWCQDCGVDITSDYV